MDAATVGLRKPSVARIQVEVDVLKTLPARIWIGWGENEGFWQNVQAENWPSYCTHCWHIGHDQETCHVKYPELKIVQESKAVSDKQEVEKGKPARRWIYRPKQKEGEDMETGHQWGDQGQRNEQQKVLPPKDNEPKSQEAQPERVSAEKLNEQCELANKVIILRKDDDLADKVINNIVRKEDDLAKKVINGNMRKDDDLVEVETMRKEGRLSSHKVDMEDGNLQRDVVTPSQIKRDLSPFSIACETGNKDDLAMVLFDGNRQEGEGDEGDDRPENTGVHSLSVEEVEELVSQSIISAAMEIMEHTADKVISKEQMDTQSNRFHVLQQMLEEESGLVECQEELVNQENLSPRKIDAKRFVRKGTPFVSKF